MKIVTHNKNKYIEYNEKFKEYSIDLEWVNLEYFELQADNLEDVVKFSIGFVKETVAPPFFLEDAGLFIKSLKGFPGPYSSYIQEKIGNKGILKLMDGIDDRKADFYAVIGYYDGNNINIFKGQVKGKITLEERGKNGFGYDPIFMPLNSSKTFAEMDIFEKNRFSHRSDAFNKFISFLKKIQ